MSSTANKIISDVSHPDKTPTESTSRPIIVTNRSMVKDQTVKTDEDDKSATSKKVEVPIKSEAKHLEPVSKDLSSKKIAEEEVASTDASKKDETDDQIAPEQADKTRQAQVTAEEKARQTEVSKLVASGKYVVPVGHIERNQRLRKVLTITVLILLIGLIAGDLLVDSGIIKTSVKPPIDLIKN